MPDTPPKADMDWEGLAFALTPTDFMYVATCKAGEEWKPGSLKPYGNIEMSPAAGVLNYGQGIFEGLKAIRTATGDINLFRPDANAERMYAGAKRLGMPPVPKDMFVSAAKAVTQANAKWVPPAGQGALYLRPCLWGSGAQLGVAAAPEYTFMIYVSPVGRYFKGGVRPIGLRVADEYHRAAPGGQGGVKAIGNYAPGIVPSKMAKHDGFDEVLYLDAVQHRYVEEVGAANFFCLKDKVLRTPQLVGTILPGVTRQSVLQLAKDMGYEVREERVDIDVAMSADEAFCTGTAAVVAPIGKIQHGNRTSVFCSGQVGPVTEKLYDLLTGIQQGRHPDRHGWVVPARDTARL